MQGSVVHSDPVSKYRFKPVSRDARRQRASPGRELYGTERWRRLRKRILAGLPDCAECGEPAKHVDHIRPHRGDVQLFFDLRNLRQLCVRCHSRKTARTDGGFGNKPREAQPSGCDAAGEPIDPEHPWNRS